MFNRSSWVWAWSWFGACCVTFSRLFWVPDKAGWIRTVTHVAAQMVWTQTRSLSVLLQGSRGIEWTLSPCPQGSELTPSDRLRRPTIWEGRVQFHWAAHLCACRGFDNVCVEVRWWWALQLSDWRQLFIPVLVYYLCIGTPAPLVPSLQDMPSRNLQTTTTLSCLVQIVQ